MMRSHDSNLPSTERAKQIVSRTLDGDYDLLLACRDLANLKEQLPGVADNVMDIFVGVASEIDDLPLGPERTHWNPQKLKLKDVEASDYRERVSGAVKNALKELLAALSGRNHLD